VCEQLLSWVAVTELNGQPVAVKGGQVADRQPLSKRIGRKACGG
jgi:hypothetical protein